MACNEGDIRQDPETGLTEKCIGGEWTPLPPTPPPPGISPGLFFRIPDVDALQRLLARADIQQALADPLKKLWVTVTDDDTPPLPRSGRERPPAP